MIIVSFLAVTGYMWLIIVNDLIVISFWILSFRGHCSSERGTEKLIVEVSFDHFKLITRSRNGDSDVTEHY